MASNDPRHQDWSAILGARRELGDEYDRAFVEGVVERVSAEVDSQVDARLAQLGARWRAPGRRRGLTLASLVLAIPISAVAGSYGHLGGIAVSWGGIVLVNAVNSWRPGDRPPKVPSRLRSH